MKILIFLCFALIEISHQLPIVRPDLYLSQFNGVKGNTFAHRLDSITKVSQYRTQLSTAFETYYTNALNMVEANINIIAESDLALQQALGNEFQSSCIANIKMMIDSTLETAGYEVSNCVSDVDGVAATAYKTAATSIDTFDRTFNQEPTILTNAFIGRNIFTEGKAIVTRATSLYNARVKTYTTNLADTATSVTDAQTVFDVQIAIMDTCFKAFVTLSSPAKLLALENFYQLARSLPQAKLN